MRAIVLALALCGTAHADVPLTKAQQSAVKKAVLADLRDPESARFGDMRAGREGTTLWVCGTVNAKNAMGGYVGHLPGGAYMGRFQGATFIVEEMGPRALGERCARLGVAVR